MEVEGAVRGRVGPDYQLGVGLWVESVRGGTSVEELIAITAVLERTGLIDFVDVSIGSYFRQEKFIGGMYEPAGDQLPTSLPGTRPTQRPPNGTRRSTAPAQAGPPRRRAG